MSLTDTEETDRMEHLTRKDFLSRLGSGFIDEAFVVGRWHLLNDDGYGEEISDPGDSPREAAHTERLEIIESLSSDHGDGLIVGDDGVSIYAIGDSNGPWAQVIAA